MLALSFRVGAELNAIMSACLNKTIYKNKIYYNISHYLPQFINEICYGLPAHIYLLPTCPTKLRHPCGVGFRMTSLHFLRGEATEEIGYAIL